MRLTDRKRDALLERIEAARRQVLDARNRLIDALDLMGTLDGELHLIQSLAKEVEANQTQEPPLH